MKILSSKLSFIMSDNKNLAFKIYKDYIDKR